ncbi:hypothetical protein [Luteimonas sp. RC10]|uniref:XAC0095 family protein n=1 Tax=Luteimonas sp. RC10 TaxID=2587035 RepID=UPI00161E174D|nr:hypothetical protein [Luteimonas sp. RC10]MBB3344873.1 hypothetical protein [Luteimonas sp. RC10]
MSYQAANDRALPGYFLTEPGQVRLKQLHDHMVFLSRLAQPRTLDEEREGVPDVRKGELATCLGLLAEQAERVLAAISDAERRPGVAGAYGLAEGEAGPLPSPPPRAGEGAGHGASERAGHGAGEKAGHDKGECADHDDGEDADHDVWEAEGSGGDDGDGDDEDVGHGERFVYGMTLDQMDALDRLVQTLTAHGDVIASGNDDLADDTLPALGMAIIDGTDALRAILEQLDDQRLTPGRRQRSGVREARPAYGAVSPRPLGASLH